MTRIALTGANGFLGWHTRAALLERDSAAERIVLGGAFGVEAAVAAVSQAERVIHLAGVNRATEQEVREGNACFARQLAEALTRAALPPRTLVYANSMHAGNGTAYGDAKAHAAEILAAAAAEIGATFVDLRLPNLFGEHGKPFYNSVAATFAHQLAVGAEPVLQRDRALTLLHAQHAAELLLGWLPPQAQGSLEQTETVSGLLERLRRIAETYRAGEIPPIATIFERDLFNTYRSFAFPAQAPIPLAGHEDARGSFRELVRSHAGSGQTSFSTTVPGVTRGDHVHRRKVERFVVLRGSARIRLRKLFDEHILRFDVEGGDPVAVDIPTLWTHSIENTGQDLLCTVFWTNDLFDPEHPDTIAEAV